VPVTNKLEAVVRVFPIVIVQSAELSVADKEISVTRLADAIDEIIVPVAVLDTLIPVAVAPTNTAVAVEYGTLIRNHAVPSLAMAQSRVAVAVEVTGKNRLETLTVFGVAV
jgi:hypothetical protein